MVLQPLPTPVLLALVSTKLFSGTSTNWPGTKLIPRTTLNLPGGWGISNEEGAGVSREGAKGRGKCESEGCQGQNKEKTDSVVGKGKGKATVVAGGSSKPEKQKGKEVLYALLLLRIFAYFNSIYRSLQR